jgi:hypothetical protein
LLVHRSISGPGDLTIALKKEREQTLSPRPSGCSHLVIPVRSDTFKSCIRSPFPKGDNGLFDNSHPGPFRTFSSLPVLKTLFSLCTKSKHGCTPPALPPRPSQSFGVWKAGQGELARAGLTRPVEKRRSAWLPSRNMLERSARWRRRPDPLAWARPAAWTRSPLGQCSGPG